VHFTGWVEDVAPWFNRSRVMVVPLRSGSGMRVKILDAFARGVPVVSTTIGMEGIDAVDGEHALIADTPESFADATARLLEVGGLADRLSRGARALALERYDAAVVGERQLHELRRFGRNERAFTS
jgi:glycosyltransferase involved in cell wall biosynthesis